MTSPAGGRTPLRICLDARVGGGAAGGTQQFVIGLASGLGRLEGDEQYLFLAHPGSGAWLEPYLGANSRVLDLPLPPRRWTAAIGDAFPMVNRLYGALFPHRSGAAIPHSDGTIERAGARVMHFTQQWGFRTEVPSIYHPHDLQHLHLPDLFDEPARKRREVFYRGLCEQAAVVAVSSSWVKDDVVDHYGLAPEKVQVVPLAPAIGAYPDPTHEDLARVSARLSLPLAFGFYPAQTWPHKNHLGLLEALALLRDRHGVSIPFLFSGHQNEFFPTIEGRARALGLTEAVRFLGFVTPLEMQCLYRLCRCVVIPTRFEAASFPLWEAFLAGAPAACSAVTSLPRQAGDAALLFDPDRAEEIADALKRLWTEPSLREELVRRGRRNVARFSWDRTARLFRAHYRRLGGQEPTEEDRALLTSLPLL